MSDQKVKVVIDIAGERWPASISRVPCLKENILFRKTLYDVTEIVHHTNGDEIAAEITVKLADARDT